MGQKSPYLEAVETVEDSPRVSDSTGSPSVSSPEERDPERMSFSKGGFLCVYSHGDSHAVIKDSETGA
jgi:hypothetical protein